MTGQGWWTLLAFLAVPVGTPVYLRAVQEYWTRRCTHYYSTSDPLVCLFCRRRREDEIA